MIRLLFLSRGFERGGAERQIIELIRGMDKSRFSVVVATFYDGGPLRHEIESLGGIQVISLHKKNRWDLLPFLWRLWRIVREHKPHIIHGYMGVPNELALLMGKLSGAKVVWGVRSSNLDLNYYGWLLKVVFRLECLLSRFPDLIIANSYAGRDYHLAQGFSAEKLVVVPNGINTEIFKPDLEAREKVRAEWEISKDKVLIGLVGRLNPMKDHPTFLKAAALFSQDRQDVYFVCIGEGIESYVSELRQLASELQIAERIIWAGARTDMPAVYNAIDVASSSSFCGEGFSNALGEAMACGVPCVVTNVGDSAWIVSDTGIVISPRNPEALAAGWMSCLQGNSRDMKLKARARIVQNFSIQTLVQSTEKLLLSLSKKSCN